MQNKTKNIISLYSNTAKQSNVNIQGINKTCKAGGTDWGKPKVFNVTSQVCFMKGRIIIKVGKQYVLHSPYVSSYGAPQLRNSRTVPNKENE